MNLGITHAFDEWQVQRPTVLSGTALVVQENGTVSAGDNYPAQYETLEPRGMCEITIP